MPIVIAVWALAVVGGMAAVWRYKLTPGSTPAAAPAIWPADVPLARAPGEAVVVMLAHPKCPCTKASISELAMLMARIGRSTTAYVLFVAPDAVGDEVEHGDSWKRAAAIPGVRVVRDPTGALARRFGATVSGHTVAYDADGRLAYAGGITPSRGHEGDNEGRFQIVARIEGARRGAAAHGPTFGCELFDEDGGAP